MYTGTVQKLPTKSNTDSNIMRCSQVPRFKYLTISTPALSSRSHKSLLQSTSDDSHLEAIENHIQMEKDLRHQNLMIMLALEVLLHCSSHLLPRLGANLGRTLQDGGP